MTKIAASKTTKEEKVTAAKRAFILGLFDISWKLAGAFLIPVAIGLSLDKGDSKTYGTIGIFVGVILAFLVIAQIARNMGDEK